MAPVDVGPRARSGRGRARISPAHGRPDRYGFDAGDQLASGVPERGGGTAGGASVDAPAPPHPLPLESGHDPRRGTNREHPGENEGAAGHLPQPAKSRRRRGCSSTGRRRTPHLCGFFRIVPVRWVPIPAPVREIDGSLHLTLKVPVHARDPLPVRGQSAVDVVQRRRQLASERRFPRPPFLRTDQTQAHRRVVVPGPHEGKVRRRRYMRHVVSVANDRRPGVQGRGRVLGPEQRNAPPQLRRGGHAGFVPRPAIRGYPVIPDPGRSRPRAAEETELRVAGVDDLLRLHLVRHPASRVDPPAIKPRPRVVPRPARHDRHRHLAARQRRAGLRKVPVAQRRDPPRRGDVTQR
mmetsp:Transcript_13105/g.59170  ORF Transcript_13105/g.59170 Transcript_13105/m.59170 type:complete len:351 (-) Transcript_13105:732-1784(-)